MSEFRQRILEEVATSDLPGMIFTYVWALDEAGDREQIESYSEIFKKRSADVYFVEVEAIYVNVSSGIRANSAFLKSHQKETHPVRRKIFFKQKNNIA